MGKYNYTIQELMKENFEFKLNDYPIFDEDYRSYLNSVILNYYMMYEIGLDTPELFNMQLQLKMHIVMPRINAIYSSYNQVQDFLENNKYTETSNTTGSNQNNTGGEKIGSNKNAFSDTPKSYLLGQNIENQNYLTDFTADESSEYTQNISTDNSQNNNERNVSAITGEKALILKNLQESLIDVDMLVIRELRELFMLVF